MRIPFIFLIAIGLSGCSDKDKESNDATIIVNKEASVTTTLEDSIVKIKNTIVDSFPQSVELIIYPFHHVEMRNHYRTGFIPLGSGWSEHIDSIYLGMTEYKDDNYHILENKYRARFLSFKKIDESNQIFIYNVALDSIVIYNVKDIPIIAFINPYGANGSVLPSDFKVGFEIKNSALVGKEFIGAFVYVGKLNPFVKGGLKPIVWKKIENEEFPSSELNTRDSLAFFRYKNQDTIDTYAFKGEKLEYFVQTLGKGKNRSTRHLKVVSLTTKKVVFSEIYNDSEGSYIRPLNNIEGAFTGDPNQWVGELFKNRPPVVFGFLGMSFGCPNIDFIDESEPAIRIQCDNRH